VFQGDLRRPPDSEVMPSMSVDGPRAGESKTGAAGSSSPADDAASPETASDRALETRRLFVRYQRHGDDAAREEIVGRFLPLARQLARRYQRVNEPLDDLVQVACIGLVKAVDRFDVDRGVAFSSYAVPTILGELKRYFRDSGWAVHVPRGVQERAMQVDRAIKDLGGRLGRSPSVHEVAAAIDASVEEVLGAMEAGLAYEAVSLDAQRSSGDSESDTFADSIGEEDDRFELVEYGATIAPTLRALPKRDQLVLQLRFVEDLTQSQIAERIGVSQMQVSRLIRRALARLRTVAEAS
jgi:RNA polymerase sigma-B factor